APVVALESTIISHGLPRPGNLDAAREFEAILAGQGVTAATIALVDGVPRVGLTPDELERIATDESVVKVSSRDIAIAVARKVTGGTTVAATSVLAAREAFGDQAALLVANPLPPGKQLDPEVLSGALEAALVAAADAGIRGKAVSPFLLDEIQRVTGGVSVGVNLDIARGNVDLAARISRSWSERAEARAPS